MKPNIAINTQKTAQVSPQSIQKKPSDQNPELFKKVFEQVVDAKPALTDTTRIAAAAQEFMTTYIDEKKKKSKVTNEELQTNPEAADESDQAIQNGKKILKSIFENTNTPYSTHQNPLTGLNHYAGPISSQKNEKPTLVAQADINAAPETRTYPRRRPSAPQAITSRGVMPITPFQLFLNKAVDFFDGVSQMEMSTDSLMKDYVDGKASLEELSLAKAKIGIAITFSMTLVNQVTQTFKEIQNMQV